LTVAPRAVLLLNQPAALFPSLVFPYYSLLPLRKTPDPDRHN